VSLAIEISKRLFLVNSASAVLTQLLRVSVLAWLYQHLLNRISTEEFAVYAVVANIVAFLPLFSTLFTSGISRYVIEACAHNDERRIRQIVSSILPVLIVWSVALLGVGFLFAWKITRVLNVPAAHAGEARLMLCLLVINFAVNMVLSPFCVGFNVRQKFALQNGIQLLSEVARIGLLFGLMYGVSTRVLWVVVATAATGIISQIVSVIVSRRLLPALRFERALSDFRAAKQLLSFGLWTTVGHLAYLIYMYVDSFILNKLGTSLDVTNFSMGSQFYLQLQALINLTIGIVLPALTAMHAQGNWEGLGAAYLRGSRYILWMTMLAACPLIVFARELILLYVGPKYLGAAPVIMLLLSLLPLAQTIGLLPPLASATAQLRQFCMTSLISQLLKLGLTLYLVGPLHMGATGCALSTTLVIGLAVMVGFWPLGLKLAHVSFGRFAREVLWRGLLPTCIAIGGGFIVRSFGLPLTWFFLGAQAALCGLIYVASLFAFCLDGEERGWGVRLLKYLRFEPS
jgi:O-antigen/teichoic acid export membrane protein